MGSYSITAKSVSNAGTTYSPVVLSSPALERQDRTTNVAVEYQGADSPPYHLQAVQTRLHLTIQAANSAGTPADTQFVISVAN